MVKIFIGRCIRLSVLHDSVAMADDVLECAVEKGHQLISKVDVYGEDIDQVVHKANHEAEAEEPEN